MLRKGKITTAATAIVVIVTAMIAAYIWSGRHGSPTADEFSVYAAFLSRLSKDDKLSPDLIALADTSFQLTAITGENWIPVELRPYPPDKAEASKDLIDFCGAWCGRAFMAKNLRAWRLEPSSTMRFPFGIVPEPSYTQDEKRIVTVTRPGFDLWRRRAAFTYSFDCRGGRPEVAVSCVQFGHVLLEMKNGGWQVVSYSAFVV